jgi:predicted dehydrogenase/NADPH:quinone reductase-like Zn-dependent oxidoreductase
MASVESVLRAVYDKTPEELRPALKRSYHWTRLRARAAASGASITALERVVFVGFGIASLEPHEILGPANGEVLVATAFSAVSPGTEGGILAGSPGIRQRFPHFPGYSGSGIVKEVGPSVSTLKPGDRIAGRLRHASSDLAPADFLVRVPEGVSLEDASFVVLGAIALQGVRKARINTGDRVAVIGQGLIGQLASRLARLSGSSHLIAVAETRNRAQTSLGRGGADAFVAVSDGAGSIGSIEAQVVIEAAGTPGALAAALRAAAPGGRVVVLGSGRLLDRDADWARLVREKDLTVVGAHVGTVAQREASPTRWSYQHEAALFLNLIKARRLSLRDLVTWRPRPEECNAVYEELGAAGSGHVGICFDWRPQEPFHAGAAPAAAAVAPAVLTKRATDALRVAIVGAGAIGQHNAREAAQTPSVALVGVFDTNQKASIELGAKVSAASYRSYEALLAQADVEAVMLNVPHHLHREMAIEAASRGKHILIEKPLANSLEEADDIIAACRKHGVVLAVGFSFRYLPRIQAAKQLVDEGALGTITGLQAIAHSYREPGYWRGARSASADDWRLSKMKAGAGYLFMNLCHVIDYLYFVTSLRADRVYCEHATLGANIEVEDTVSISCRLTNGAVGTIAGSCSRRGADQAEDRIWGSHGTISIAQEGLSVYSTRPVRGHAPGKTFTIDRYPTVSWTSAWLSDVAASIRAGREPAISGRDGWENLAFITSALRSMDEHRSVDVPRFGGTRP